MTKIRFGTDGWRGMIGNEFMRSNVKVVSQAIAEYMKAHDLVERDIVMACVTAILFFGGSLAAPGGICHNHLSSCRKVYL